MSGGGRLGGGERLALWRESGAWWAGEPGREFVQWRDARGVRREKSRELPGFEKPYEPVAYDEDLSTEITLRPRKTRDEKVAMACGATDPPGPRSSGARLGYAALRLVSGYSFGRSVLLARELPRRCAAASIAAAAITDHFALTGAVEFVREAKECGVRALVGASFEMDVGGEVVLLARNKTGYSNLSQLVSRCHLEEPRLFPLCTRARLEAHSEGLLCLTGGDNGRLDQLLLRGQFEEAARWLDFLIGLYGRGQVFVEVERSYLPWGLTVERRLVGLAESRGVRVVAGGPVLHARPEDFPAQDVALCAQTLCTVEEVLGRKPLRHPDQPQAPTRPQRSLNAERHLRTPVEAAEIFRDRPEWLEATWAVVERCDEDVLPGRTRLPQLFGDPGRALTEAVSAGASKAYGKPSRAVLRRIDTELDRILRLGFADHFLAAWDMCRWAREQGILYSGRGSVVDSVVSFCLGFSRIDAHRHQLHFDRFLPEDGSKRPDIDIDFEARRRDDVRNYLVSRYGVERVATVAAIGAYNTRGIVREVGKALGLTPEALGFLSKRLHGGVTPEQLESALDKRPELRGAGIDRERLGWLFRLARDLADVPRNMRAHSSGVVVSDRPLTETVPVMWGATDAAGHPGRGLGGPEREGPGPEGHLRIIQWDKRSAKHYFDKFDILCLRGQDVLAGTQSRVRRQQCLFDVEKAPVDDEETYRAMRSGELIGIPQSASPAMRQAHVRVQTANLADASLVQAGIRPGVGGAVKINELIARRRGKPYDTVHPELEKILGHTYGIVVFQEQIDQLLQVFAGYSSGEAEDIRDAVHKRRKEDYGRTIREEVTARILARGFGADIADHVFELIAGFKGYGFAQGHALAFAEISIRSIFCQQNFPAEYFAALLDAQPAGYYGPCTLVNEARSRGVAVLPVDVGRSGLTHAVEDVLAPEEPRLVVPNGGIRLPLRIVKGLSKETALRTVERRGADYDGFHDYVRRVRPQRDELEALVLCGAFDRWCPNRRALLWAAPSALAWASACEGLLTGSGDAPPIDLDVADFTEAEKRVRERAVLGLDIERHLMAFERERVASRGGITTAEARRLPPGRRAVVVGNPIRLRFPPTPSGKRVVFFDLEDETGLLNVTCFDRVYQRDGHAIVCSPYLTLIGVAQWRDGHTAFLAQRAFPYNPVVSLLAETVEPPVATADFLVG